MASCPAPTFRCIWRATASRLAIERTVSAGVPAGEVLLSRAADLGTDLPVKPTSTAFRCRRREERLGRPQIRGGEFVDQLMDDRLALGDLATFSVLERVCNGERPGPTL
jgi:hypothetical protein